MESQIKCHRGPLRCSECDGEKSSTLQKSVSAWQPFRSHSPRGKNPSFSLVLSQNGNGSISSGMHVIRMICGLARTVKVVNSYTSVLLDEGARLSVGLKHMQIIKSPASVILSFGGPSACAGSVHNGATARRCGCQARLESCSEESDICAEPLYAIAADSQ